VRRGENFKTEYVRFICKSTFITSTEETHQELSLKTKFDLFLKKKEAMLYVFLF
jgi:hypothetical protein